MKNDSARSLLILDSLGTFVCFLRQILDEWRPGVLALRDRRHARFSIVAEDLVTYSAVHTALTSVYCSNTS